MFRFARRLPSLAAVLLLACQGAADRGAPPGNAAAGAGNRRDVHSFARPGEVAVEHLDLDLEVDFESRRLAGRASLRLDNPAGARRLRLDTRDLDILGVTLDGGEEAAFELGAEVPFLGRELGVEIEPGTEVVHVDHRSRPEAGALQWLGPEQTAGGRHPFLFSQSPPTPPTPLWHNFTDRSVEKPPDRYPVRNVRRRS